MADDTHDEFARLNTTLKSLSADCPPQQKLTTERQLAGLLRNHKSILETLLQFPVEKVALTMMFSYTERVGEMMQWVKEMREKMREPVEWRNLESVRTSLNQQLVCTQLN